MSNALKLFLNLQTVTGIGLYIKVCSILNKDVSEHILTIFYSF